MVSMGPNSYSRLYFHMTDFQDKGEIQGQLK